MIRKIIFRELKSSPKFILFFILNLAIGLTGLSSIEFLKEGMVTQVAGQAKAILGADLVISSRIKISPEQVDKVKDVFNVTDRIQNITLFSMGQFRDNAKLISVRAIDLKFPFYGKIVMANNSKIEDLKDNEIFLYNELKIQLGINLGDSIKIGEEHYIVKDFVMIDPSANLQFGALAPRAFITHEGLNKSLLLKNGATAFYEYLFKVSNPSGEVENLKKTLVHKINDNAIQVNVPATSSDQVSRVMAYLNDFLGLVSLSGLFLSSFGLIYLFKSYLYTRRREFAIFKFLGISKIEIFLIYFGELLILGILGSIVGSLLGLTLYPLVVNILSALSGASLAVSISAKTFIIVLGIGVVATVTLAPMLLVPYLNIDYKILFSHSDEVNRKFTDYLLFIPMIVFYWIVSVYLSKSIIIGSLFIGLFILLSILIFPISKILLKNLNIKIPKLKLTKKLALTYISRHYISATFVFGTIFVATFLMTLIPVIKSSINKEIETPTTSNGPSLFLFDIQDEQVSELEALAQDYKLGLLNKSPMIRARLISVNGNLLATDMSEQLTREEQNEVRSRNRGVNLTYRSKLDEGETLIAGRLPINNLEANTEVYEISLEQRYAGRIGAKLGDELLFDVLDMPIRARVVGLRQVRWTTFLPNFFINFGTGVLEDAPKTFLMAYSNPETKNLDLFQTEVAKKLSNISVVDVVRVVERLKTTIDNMSKILTIMSLVTFVVGLLVIYSLISHQVRLRSVDISLYKLLGLERKNILEILNFEMRIISFAAIISGLSLSCIFGWVLGVYILKTSFSINFYELFFNSLFIFILIQIINYTAVSKITAKKINDVFSEIN